jgi:hypothetical protein
MTPLFSFRLLFDFTLFFYCKKRVLCVCFVCEKHLHDPIIYLIVEVWSHKVSLTLPHFIEVPVSNYTSEQSCICVLGGHWFYLFLRF